MLKKITLFSLLLLIFSPVCMAQYYIGLGIGPEMTHYSQKTTVVNPFINVRNNTQLSGTGIFGSLFAGYGCVFNNFYYLGGELNGAISSDKFSSSNKEFVNRSFSRTTYEMNNHVGVSLLPGLMITPSTLLYVRLGYSNGNFEINTTDTSLYDLQQNLNGFRYGLGLNQAICQNLSLRIECSSISYQSVDLHVLDNTSRTTIDTQISPRTTQVELGLIYNFCA